MSALVAELRRRARDEHVPRHGEVVTVSTIHKAKGMEWDAVLLPRLTEGSLPSAWATSPEELAEERRLLYVGITRAREHLELSCARMRGDGGRSSESSRFLAVIFPPQTMGSHARANLNGGGSLRAHGIAYAVGDRVTHDSYGLGKVVTVQGRALVIDFGDPVGVRTVGASDRKLIKL